MKLPLSKLSLSKQSLSKLTVAVTLCCTVISLTACTTSSTGRNQITLFSNSELGKMGIASFDEMKKKEAISQGKATNQFVQCVANAIIKNVPESAHQGEWEVVVFDSEQINAFALPGGKIGVYTGILNVTENQDQLGAIIGHEVGHVIEHHSNERLSSNQLSQTGLSVASAIMQSQKVESQDVWMAGLGLGLQYGVLMPYSRVHESEADIVGQDLMARSGFAPKASIKLWQNMEKASKLKGQSAPPEFMSTHPSNQTRIAKLTEHLAISKNYYQVSNAPDCVKPAFIPKPKPKK
ncbi:MAG: M48 family metallopeptidase [Alteromonadaceae bacterium]|nr:M48 family metallopeptidase [Alteromonadaceae bacterium]